MLNSPKHQFVFSASKLDFTVSCLSLAEEPLAFLSPLADQELMEYETLTLECTVSKADRPATWYKDGTKLTPSERVTISAKDTQHKLSVERVDVDDEAEYSIKVDDLTSKCTVLVEGEEPQGGLSLRFTK